MIYDDVSSGHNVASKCNILAILSQCISHREYFSVMD